MKEYTKEIASLILVVVSLTLPALFLNPQEDVDAYGFAVAVIFGLGLFLGRNRI